MHNERKRTTKHQRELGKENGENETAMGGFFCYSCFRSVLFVETEKYAHVTFFFNGGVEKQFEGEERGLVPSPKVPTYDLKPEMNSEGVATEVNSLKPPIRNVRRAW